MTSKQVVSLKWRDEIGKARGSVLLATAETHVRLLYRSRRAGENWKDVDETVSLVWTSCHYGGNRPWFLCPGGINGRSCRRRVAILYAAGPYFLCRYCSRLSYKSQNEDRLSRRIRKARTLRARLGVSANLQEPILWKPPHMHWKTFSRLALQARTVEGSSFELIEAWAAHRRAVSESLLARADVILERYKKRSSSR